MPADFHYPHCVPVRSVALAPLVSASAPTPSEIGLYAFLRDAACVLHPGDFEAAFRQLCEYAKDYARGPAFCRWASDFRNCEDARKLRALAALDVDDFFRRYPPNDRCDGDFEAPPLDPDVCERELELA
jgi:hypothetical protein